MQINESQINESHFHGNKLYESHESHIHGNKLYFNLNNKNYIFELTNDKPVE